MTLHKKCIILTIHITPSCHLICRFLLSMQLQLFTALIIFNVTTNGTVNFVYDESFFTELVYNGRLSYDITFVRRLLDRNRRPVKIEYQ